MIITDKLANRLMDDLLCVAISALGGYPEEGLSLETQKICSKWARTKFLELTDEWQDITGEEWEIYEIES